MLGDYKMEKEKKSRREALGLIGKAGILMGAVPYFFVSLKIYPEIETDFKSELSGRQQDRTKDVQEKAVISGSGSKLMVTISGKAGRHFFVALAGSDVIEKYRRFPNTNGIINSRGIGSVVINLESITTSRIYLKIVTGDTKDFNTHLAQTEAFIVTTKGGVLDTFEGVVSRPIIEPGSTRITCAASLAAAGANSKFQLN
jgi:hypothetical protein